MYRKGDRFQSDSWPGVHIQLAEDAVLRGDVPWAIGQAAMVNVIDLKTGQVDLADAFHARSLDNWERETPPYSGWYPVRDYAEALREIVEDADES